ncbi:MAG: hypothetical protein RIS88_831 [Pseudomonadota bacterium]|jgi:hypothetical protein
MARGVHLTRRSLVALALCLGLAITGHVAVLAWWDTQQVAAASPLRDLPAPLFTRLIAPVEPAPPVPAAAAALALQAPATPGVMRAALSEPTPAAATPPAPAASAPPAAAAPATPAELPATAMLAAATPEPANAPASRAGEPAVLAPERPASPTASSPVAPATAAAAADTWPPDVRLTYRLEGRWRSGPLHGSARVQWQRQGTRYQTQVEIDIAPFVHRALTSQGEVTPQGLVPRIYEERSRNRRRAMQLGDADITLADGRSVPRPADVQDTASQFVELGHRFAMGRHALALGEVITLPLARPGGVDLWTYDVIAQDLVTIPRLGEVMAWRLRPRPMAPRRDNLSAEIWFAPSLRYLPVRIRIALGDEAEIDLHVEALEQR